MRTLKVTYRAVFQQPQGPLNPMHARVPQPCPIEVFGGPAGWQAREIATAYRALYKKLGRFVSADQGKTEVAVAFERQLEPWQTWGTPPKETQARMLLPDEIRILSDGQVVWKEPEDYTHIIHAQSIPKGARVPPAACGAKVDANCFIDPRANVKPTCKACAEVWRREYQNR